MSCKCMMVIEAFHTHSANASRMKIEDCQHNERLVDFEVRKRKGVKFV